MILKSGRPLVLFFGAIKYKILLVAVLAILVGELDDNVYLLEEFDLAIPSFLGTAVIVTLAFRTNPFTCFA